MNIKYGNILIFRNCAGINALRVINDQMINMNSPIETIEGRVMHVETLRSVRFTPVDHSNGACVATAINLPVQGWCYSHQIVSVCSSVEEARKVIKSNG